MRYQFTQTDKRYDGKLVYRSTLYPTIPVTEDDIYVTLSQDDYLDKLPGILICLLTSIESFPSEILLATAIIHQ